MDHAIYTVMISVYLLLTTHEFLFYFLHFKSKLSWVGVDITRHDGRTIPLMDVQYVTTEAESPFKTYSVLVYFL